MSKNIKRGWKKSLLLKAIVLQFGMFPAIGATNRDPATRKIDISTVIRYYTI
jgi:hypothetical protein